jgi:hypothetical protein
VRPGPSTPGDYVRARVLVPRNPGVRFGVSRIECLALLIGWKLENLDAMNGGVVGVFIAPTTKHDRWLEASVRWRTGQSGAPATSSMPLDSDRWSF